MNEANRKGGSTFQNHLFTLSPFRKNTRWAVATAFLLQTALTISPAFAEPANNPPNTQTGSLPAAAAPQPEQQAAAVPPVDSLSLDYAKGIVTDTGKIIVSPIHWGTDDWLKVGLVAGTTVGLFFLDGSIRDFAQSHQNSTASNIAVVGNDLGNPLFTLPPVAAFYLYGALADDQKARKTSLLAVESLAISELFTETIKLLTQRDRPSSGQPPDIWNGPHKSTKNLSFYSGHTSSAFSIATVFAEQYKETWYVPALAYSMASLTGLSRIYGNAHWASDVFFGAAVGYFVGKTVVKFHDDGDAASKVSVTPAVGSGYLGLTAQYKF